MWTHPPTHLIHRPWKQQVQTVPRVLEAQRVGLWSRPVWGRGQPWQVELGVGPSRGTVVGPTIALVEGRVSNNTLMNLRESPNPTKAVGRSPRNAGGSGATRRLENETRLKQFQMTPTWMGETDAWMVATTNKEFWCHSKPYQRNQRKGKWAKSVVPATTPRPATVHQAGRPQYPQDPGRSLVRTSYPVPCAQPPPPSADNISGPTFGLGPTFGHDPPCFGAGWALLDCFSQACSTRKRSVLTLTRYHLPTILTKDLSMHF